MGELLVRVTTAGLDRLEHRILTGNTNALLHDISTVASIGPYEIADVIQSQDALIVSNEIENGNPIKVELMSFGDQIIDENAVTAFTAIANSLGCKICSKLRYSDHLVLYELSCPSRTVLDALSELPLVRRISFFPQYHSLEWVPNKLPMQLGGQALQPVSGYDYPIVGILDSGIPIDHPQLSPWVIGRKNYIPTMYQNNSHGTFIGGILVHSHLLDPSSDDSIRGCWLFDACIMPNNDKKMGPVKVLREQDLILRIEEVVKEYHTKVRVWNLSLGTNETCSDFKVTDLAVKLDSLADKYDICFIIACGNYSNLPLRGWPPTQPINDRITAPSDSIRSISVGAIAGSGNAFTAVQGGEPAPYSRRGPGPSFIIKPDLVHLGGNCSTMGKPVGQGIRSWNPNGLLNEDCGTSYAAPRVARLRAGIDASFDEPPSQVLARALLIHSARLPGTDRRPTGDDLHYYGFGMPGPLESILTCSRSAITLVWEAETKPKRIFSIDDFPYPNCLKTPTGWVGDIWMTLVYDPPLEHTQRFEYCRLNLDAHLGLYKTNSKGKLKFEGQVPAEVTWEERYEKSLIKHGFKWSPTKVYRRSMPNGVDGDNWRLYLSQLARSDNDVIGPQAFALVVTIADPKGQADVYSDVVQQLQARFVTVDLAVKQRIRNAMGL